MCRFSITVYERRCRGGRGLIAGFSHIALPGRYIVSRLGDWTGADDGPMLTGVLR